MSDTAGESTEGPLLEHLTARMAEPPPEFLMAPRIGAAGIILVEAVVSDLLLDLGGRPLPESALPRLRAASPDDGPRLQFLLLGAWLLYDPEFQQAKRHAPAAFTALLGVAQELAGHVEPGLTVTDPDRREEFVRLLLRGLDLRPAGESAAHAADRLRAISTRERKQMVKDTRAKLEKARKLAEALRKKDAEDAAARVNRE